MGAFSLLLGLKALTYIGNWETAREAAILLGICVLVYETPDEELTPKSGSGLLRLAELCTELPPTKPSLAGEVPNYLAAAPIALPRLAGKP